MLLMIGKEILSEIIYDCLQQEAEMKIGGLKDCDSIE